MSRKVVFRDGAIGDLNALYDYIAGQSSPDVAIGYIRRIREVCMGLADFPERGRRRDDIWQGLRVLGFERRVSIAFRVLRARVEIVTIAYGGRDFESALRKRK